MLFYAITGLINAAASTFLGFLVYLKNQKANINKIFALFCSSIAIWGYSYFIWQTSTDKETALFWSRALMIGAIFMPITYFHFITAFLGIHQKKKNLLILGYSLSFIFLILNFTPLFVKSVECELSFLYWPKPGIAYHPFLLTFFLYFFYSWYLLYKALPQATKILQIQIRYLLIGSIVGFFGGATNYFLWYDIPIPPFGSILITFFTILTAFAATKYHLFEIKVILTELLVGVIAMISLIEAFIFKTFWTRVLGFSVSILFCFIGYLLIKATHREIKAKEILEERVKERTKELETAKDIAEGRAKEIEKRKEDLEKFYKLTVGRELRMIELKKQIKELEEKMKEESQ